MFRRFGKTAAALLLAFALLLGAAFAETVKLPYSDGSLWVRGGPGKTYEKVTYVRNGQDITVLEKGAEWSKIRVTSSGNVGYIKNKYITGSSSSGGSGSSSNIPGGTYDLGRVTTKYASSRVNLRKGPGTKYGVVATYGRGAVAQITGSDGNWYIVRMRDGSSGYMSKSYIAIGVSGKATANVNLRKGAGTSYGVLKVVPKGTAVTVLSVSGSWAKVQYGSTTGYIYTKYLSL